jgi:hypothetical protein
VYDAPSGVQIRELFVDHGLVSVLWVDSQSVGLTQLGSQAPVFTTPIAGGVGLWADLPVAVVEAEGNAFYASQGALHAVSMQTASDRVLGTPGSCVPMFADATAVFCALGGKVISFSLPQGSMQVVADLSPAKVDDLYADATTLYVTGRPSNGVVVGAELWSAPRAGGSVTMLATADSQELGFGFIQGQADDSNLYLSIALGFARMSKSTHQIDIVFQNGSAASGGCFGDPYISGGYFYYGCSGTLYRGPLATGGTPWTDVTDDDGDFTVVTSNVAYWVSFLSSAGHEVVVRAPLPQ